jgi:hypothetical protein
MSSIAPLPGTLTAWPIFGAMAPYANIQPNPARTLTPENHGYAGSNFDDITPFESDTFTFDLIERLSGFGLPPASTIVSIDAFGLEAIVGADGDSAARALGVASFSGTQVSQRFGNFLQGAVRYRIFVRVTTSNDNVISNWSYFWVKMPGFA